MSIHNGTMKVADIRYYKKSLNTRKMVLLSTLREVTLKCDVDGKYVKRQQKLLCQWCDGSSDWVELKHLKDSNPIQLEEYAVANQIQEEPAFKWWVSQTLRTHTRINAKVKS